MLNVLFLNNNIEAQEAAGILNCNPEYLIELAKKKKIRGQKINGQWYLNPSDCYRFKNQLGELKPQTETIRFISLSKSSIGQKLKDSEQDIKINFPTAKHQLITSSQKTKKPSLYQSLDEKIDKVYQKLVAAN
jgi:CRISPR/Cas system CSM-associated protein Csm2 small subunit